ncbi:hypothetical protein P378_20105 [Desulforamulus profundi]|uniref:Transposase n=1 Tax=Desulforamulus profundi TaxID=1383067 RepID=A0A2C6MC23_9FIRM|nr:hypothetical protein [Desulforamulus profundi]PHJ36813.1 hypothetical protein P378_20105 [Desulforamulus profundi]
MPRQRHGGLNREEEAEFYLELAKMDRKEAEAIMQITTSWHEKGRAEGLMEGIKEGIKEGRLETARADLKKGLPEDVVAEITGLDREIIRKLKAELNRA